MVGRICPPRGSQGKNTPWLIGLRSFQSPPIVLSSLGAKLEAREAEVIQKNDEIEILKEETKSIPDILTYETKIQESKYREQTLIRENSTYIEENKTLKQRVSQLERGCRIL